jgi:hypothetical protein
LPEPDGNRRIFISPRLNTIGKEGVPRHAVEELKNLQIIDTSGSNLLDQLPPIPCIPGVG